MIFLYHPCKLQKWHHKDRIMLNELEQREWDYNQLDRMCLFSAIIGFLLLFFSTYQIGLSFFEASHLSAVDCRSIRAGAFSLMLVGAFSQSCGFFSV